MGRAIDLFVTYRFLKLLTTPFEKQDAFKLGIIDKDGNRIRQPKSTKPAVELSTSELKNSYTILHKLVFNVKKLFNNKDFDGKQGDAVGVQLPADNLYIFNETSGERIR